MDRRKGPAYETYDAWVEKLRAFRESCGLTQEDIARHTRFSRTRYGAIEKGDSVVNFVHLFNLAEAFDVTMPDMLALEIPLKNAARLKEGRS